VEDMIFVYILLGVVIGIWLIKQAIAGSGVLSKIIISLIVIAIASLLLKMITGYAVFISFAKLCACLTVLLIVVNIIRRMFADC
jgi:hypothetical protein